MIIYTRKKSHKRRAKATKHKRSRARRHNPARSHRRHRASARRRNPVHARRHTSRRRRHNPAMGKIVNKSFLINAVLATVGFVGGIKASSLIAKLPMMDKFGRFSGGINLILGMVLFAKSKNQSVKSAAAGLGASGVYDLMAKNLGFMALPSLQGVDVMGAHGIDVLPTAGEDDLDGDDDLNGVDVAGGDGPVQMLGEDNDMLGEDDMDGEGQTVLLGTGYSSAF